MDVESAAFEYAVQDLKSQAEANQQTEGVMMLQRQVAMMGVHSVTSLHFWREETKLRNAKLIQQYISNQTAWLTMAGREVVS